MEIMMMMSHNLLRNFSAEVRDRQQFALIADETADVSRVDQLSTCIRTVADNFDVEEKFFLVFTQWTAATVNPYSKPFVTLS